MNSKNTKSGIKILEIELIILLAVMLLLGILFGYSLAKPISDTTLPITPGLELMQSGLGGEEIIPW